MDHASYSTAVRKSRRAAPALERQYDQVLDRDAGVYVSLAEYLGDSTYGAIIDTKRVALENDLIEGRERFVCPDCEQAMVLRSVPTKDQTEDRFYFRHRIDNGECSGRRGLSPAAICARKYAHAKEGAQHRLFKNLIVESMEADPAFRSIRSEGRWVGIDGVRWRRPDVQCVWDGGRIAVEVQLSTTFLHVIAERMTFYRRNNGKLLWVFRDLDPGAFKLAEDDVFYSNNRNAFKVSPETADLSRERGRFALECAWHVPCIDEGGEVEDTLHRKIIFFDELTFDVSPSGVPRAFYFDYASALDAVGQEREQQRCAAKEASDQALRDDLEAAVLNFSFDTDGGPEWLDIRRRFRDRGFELPERLYGNKGPFYLLQAAFSAKRGKPVGCKIANLMGLAKNLFTAHKDTLWVFSVMMRHFDRGRDLTARGDVKDWMTKRDKYREGWFQRDREFDPNRRYDDLLVFLFPSAAQTLLQSPAQAEVLRRQSLVHQASR